MRSIVGIPPLPENRNQTMKIKVESHFKIVKDSVNGDKKRPNCVFEFDEVTQEDIAAYPAEVCAILNDAIAKHGKYLIAQNADNWDYLPPESELTIESVYAELVRETTRTRVLNKESLESLAAWYKMNALKIGKTPQVAAAGAGVISAKFKPIAGNITACNAMLRNFNAMLDNPEIVISGDLVPVLGALVTFVHNMIEETAKVSLDVL